MGNISNSSWVSMKGWIRCSAVTCHISSQSASRREKSCDEIETCQRCSRLHESNGNHVVKTSFKSVNALALFTYIYCGKTEALPEIRLTLCKKHIFLTPKERGSLIAYIACSIDSYVDPIGFYNILKMHSQ